MARRKRQTSLNNSAVAKNQNSLPITPTVDETLDISALETWLWDAACKIRGATDAPKFKDFILPLVFYKRLSDVFDDEFAGKVAEFGGEELAWELVKLDHEDALKSGCPPVIRFYIPREYRWDKLRHHPADGDLVNVISLGNAQTRPDHGAAEILNQSQLILVALDADRAGATESWRWWKEHYLQGHRWPPIQGKDPGEMLQQGIDLRLWIQVGISHYCPLRGMGEKPSPSGEDFSRLAVPCKTTARPRIPFTI